MGDKKLGLIKKYHVERVDGKAIQDAIVLEFKDPIARVALSVWATEMRAKGYVKCADEVQSLLKYYSEQGTEQ